MKKLFALLLLTATAIFPAQAADPDESPISANLKVYGTYTDNVFQTALPEFDYVMLTYLDTSYGLTPGASIFYNANLNLFSEHSDLRNHIHHLGIAYERDVSEGNGILYFGGKLGLRQNTPEYDPYNRRSGSVYTSLKYYLTETILGRVGYRLGYEGYPNYQSFSSVENYGFLQFSKFFQSRTTLQMELDAGRRGYLNLDDGSDRSYATQITGSAKIAQSLAERTGLQLQYLWHRAPQGIADDQYEAISYYSVEDFLEDDYNYSSHEYRIALKHLGLWESRLTATLSGRSKNYNTFAYGTEERREDRDTTFLLEVEKRFSLPLDSFPDFTLHLEFLHRRNNSNDPYHDYSTNIFSIGTRTAF